MLTHRVPGPPDRGDRIRAHHLLRAVSECCDVTLACLADEPVADAVRSELTGLTRELLIAPVRAVSRRALAARALFTGQAITPAAMYDPALARQLVERHRQQPFDSVLTYCTGMIGYARALYDADLGTGTTRDQQPPPRGGGSQAPRTNTHLVVGAKSGRVGRSFRHVLDLVDVDSLKWSGFAESTRGPMRLVYRAEARRLRDVEAGRVVPFDAVTVISEHEAERYRQHVGTAHTPVVVGNGVALDRFYPAPRSERERVQPVLTFTGVMSYKPNADAAAWFARRVMPRVRAAVPDARFDIVGQSPGPAVRALDELPGVRVVGAVIDTAAYLRRSAAAVAPMKLAPGVQNKVLEAMACGLAVVCSSHAAAGIDAEPGRHLLVADNEADTAAHCVRLLLHTGYRDEVGADARQRIEQRYRWHAALAPMMDLIAPVLSEHEA
ncbi:MAG: glycosyltransferase [Phycisphaeraceae bacterium]